MNPAVICIYYCTALGFFAVYHVFPDLFHRFDLVGHGKTITSATSDSGVPSLWKISKRWFTAFYIVGLVCGLFQLELIKPHNLLFMLHIIRRAIETLIWPYSSSSQMHLIHGLVGITYYPIMVKTLELADSSFSTKLYYIPLSIGLTFILIQSYCHYRLFKCRQKGTYVPLSHLGWPFTCHPTPHYVCEILIYGGLMVWSYFNFLLTLNFLFVYCNLSITEQDTRAWYHRHGHSSWNFGRETSLNLYKNQNAEL